MTGTEPVKLRVPHQDLEHFSLFQLNVLDAQRWACALPVTSSSEVASQLHTALERLNRVELAPKTRYDILEALRRPMLVAATSLSRRFLKQPLIMPEQSRAMAELTEDLYSLTGTAYTIVAVETIQQKDRITEVNPARLVCEATHRAIRCNAYRLLQTFQLYKPVASHTWLTLHQLYALAEEQGLTELTIEDELAGSGTINTAYMQAVVLGCCKPNQLRQNDMSAIYRGLQEWGSLARIHPGPEVDALYRVELDSDSPPVYSQRVEQTPGPRTRFLNTEMLERHLQQLIDTHDKGIVFDRDIVVGPHLLKHLRNSFSKMSMRNFTRKSESRPMQVALGLSACHFYMGAQLHFDQVMYGPDYRPPPSQRLESNPFIESKDEGDLWQQANPRKDYATSEHTYIEPAALPDVTVDEDTLSRLGISSEEQQERPEFLPYSVTVVDASPGGYCFQWGLDRGGEIKTGDLICVRESESDAWTLAATRWVSQFGADSVLLGVELLSPKAKAYSAKTPVLKRGDETEPQRVLLLPEIKLVGQPPTLITPKTAFREGQKIVVARHDEEFFIQLVKQVAVTGSFTQFEFRHIKQLDEVLAEDKARPVNSSFDSLWANI
ncbi:MAG: hypothetical protein AAGF57_17315 [Pseudomonadota bacterium]